MRCKTSFLVFIASAGITVATLWATIGKPPFLQHLESWRQSHTLHMPENVPPQ